MMAPVLQHWQWRIQDFTEETITPKGGPNLLFEHFSQKLHEKEESLARRTRPLHLTPLPRSVHVWLCVGFHVTTVDSMVHLNSFYVASLSYQFLWPISFSEG